MCSHSSLKTISSSLEVREPGMLVGMKINPCYCVATQLDLFGGIGLSLDSGGHQ